MKNVLRVFSIEVPAREKDDLKEEPIIIKLRKVSTGDTSHIRAPAVTVHILAGGRRQLRRRVGYIYHLASHHLVAAVNSRCMNVSLGSHRAVGSLRGKSDKL